MQDLRTRFDEEIYRPGDDVSRLARLSQDEKSERRIEIEAIFADPAAFEEQQRQRYAEADAEN